MNEKVPDFYNNKDLIFDEIWTLLSRGVVDRSEDFRLPVVIVNKGQIPDRSLVMGSPGKIIREVTDQEIEAIKENARRYSANWKNYEKGFK